MANTNIPIYGIIAPSGVQLRARGRNPDGTTAGEFPVPEDGTGLGTYSAIGVLNLADALSGNPYTIEIRQVTAQTTAAFDASVTIRAAKQSIGWVLNGSLIGDLTIFNEVAARSTVTVTPLSSVVSGPLDADQDIVVYEASAPPISWTILDATNSPVDLSAKTLRFVTYQGVVPTPTSPVIQKDNATVSGTGNNVVSVQLATTDTASAGRSWKYLLWNLSDNVVLAAGAFHVLPAVKGT